MDISAFTDPNSKNAADLVTYAIHAWESGWGYVWGTYGDVLTESLFAYKLEQYPDGVGSYEILSVPTGWVEGPPIAWDSSRAMAGCPQKR